MMVRPGFPRGQALESAQFLSAVSDILEVTVAAPRSASAYLDSLRASGLLEKPQLDELARCPEAKGADHTSLARIILQRRWLTRFQVNIIAAGRGKELSVADYVLLVRLSDNDSDAIYKARHQKTRRVVTLRIIPPKKLTGEGTIVRFLRETRTSAALRHPNVARIEESGQIGSACYVATEYVAGVDLARLVKEKGPLPLTEACEYVRQAAQGLQYFNEKGIVHGDVKPQNLIVTGRPDSDLADSPTAAAGAGKAVVKLLNAGISILQEGGSGEYQAPERSGTVSADVRADLYSLGYTLYFLLTGKKHQTDKPRRLTTVGVDAPPELQTILDRLTANKPKDRYQTPNQFVDDIAPFCREASAVFEFVDDESDGDDVEEQPEDAVQEAPVKRTTAKRSLADSDERELGKKKRKVEANTRKRSIVPLLAAGGGLVAVLAIAVVVGIFALKAWRAPQPDPVVAQGPNGPQDGGKPNPPGNGNPVPPGGVAPDLAAGPGERRIQENLPGPEFAVAEDRVIVTRATGSQLKIAVTGAADRVGFDVPGTTIDCFALSPDGGKLLTGHSDLSVRVWEVTSAKELHKLTGHRQRINRIAVAPDGKLAVSGGGIEVRDGLTQEVDSAVRVWELDSGKEVRKLEIPPESGGTLVRHLAFSPDGSRLISLNGPGAHIWDVSTGKETVQMDKLVRLDHPETAAISPGGQLILTGSKGFIALYDGKTGSEIRRFTGHRGWVMAGVFTSDGARVVAGGGGGRDPNDQEQWKIKVWDAGTGKLLRICPGHTKMVRQLAVTGGGAIVYSSADDGTLWRWDLGPYVGEGVADPMVAVTSVPKSTESRKLPVPKIDEVNVASFSPDGQQMVTAGERMRLWDFAQNKQIHDFKGKGVSLVQRMAWSTDGRMLAISHGIGQLSLFNAQTGFLDTEFTRHASPIWGLAISPDRSFIITGAGKAAQAPGGQVVYEDVDILRWRAGTGDVVMRYKGHKKPIHAIAFDPDGKHFYSASADGFAYVWELEKDTPVRSIPLHLASHVMAFSSDGRRLAYYTEGRYCQVMDMETGKPSWSSGLQAIQAYVLTWSSDGKFVTLGTHMQEGKVPYAVVLDGATGKELRKYEGERLTVTAAEVSRDGRAVVLVAPKEGVKIWDRSATADPFEKPPPVTPPKLEGPFVGHEDGPVLLVVFSSDGKKLATAGKDRTIRIWDVASGKEERMLKVPYGTATHIAFLGDGSRLAATTDAGVMDSWDLKTGNYIHQKGGGGDFVMALASDGERYAYVNKGGYVYLESTTDKTAPSRDLNGKWTTPTAAAFSGDGKVMVVASAGQYHIADLSPKKKEFEKTLSSPGADVAALAASPNGDRFAVLGKDGGVLVWDIAAGRGIYRLSAPARTVTSVAFSPDGKRLLTGGSDGVIRLWDAAKGTELASPGKTSAVNDVAFSPDGRSAVSCGEVIKIWDLEPKAPMKP
jgi:WD40 repeat protein/serine/threonine protein kinase